MSSESYSSPPSSASEKRLATLRPNAPLLEPDDNHIIKIVATSGGTLRVTVITYDERTGENHHQLVLNPVFNRR